MATKFIRQNQPAQLCGRLNTWSYAAISVRTAASDAEAKRLAKLEVVQAAQRTLTSERNSRNNRCPSQCSGGTLKGNTVPESKHINTYHDTDRNIFISYYSARWKVILECNGSSNRIAHSFTRSTQSLANNGNNPACGKTRFYSGCTLGFANASTKAKAKREAGKEAKTAAKDLLDTAKAKACPNTCANGQTAAPGEPPVIELDSYQIYQVRSNRWVGYAVAYWTVSVTCPTPAKPKKKKKKVKRSNKKGKKTKVTNKHTRTMRK